jgi:carbon starvation protein CstA
MSGIFMVVVFAVYKLVAKALWLWGRAVFVLVPGFFLMLVAMAVGRVFWPEQWMFQWGLALCVFLVAVLPLSGFIQRSSWISALILWAVVLFAAVAVFSAAQIIWPAVHRDTGSGFRAQQVRQHQEQVDQMFKGK